MAKTCWTKGAVHTDPPVPTGDLATGLPLIALPPGFGTSLTAGQAIRCRRIAGSADASLHDGMGAVGQIGPPVTVCRNHEADQSLNVSLRRCLNADQRLS